jgi:hypothetical protein
VPVFDINSLDLFLVTGLVPVAKNFTADLFLVIGAACHHPDLLDSLVPINPTSCIPGTHHTENLAKTIPCSSRSVRRLRISSSFCLVDMVVNDRMELPPLFPHLCLI